MEQKLDTTQYWNKLVEENKDVLKEYYADICLDNTLPPFEVWLDEQTVMDLEVILEI